MDTEKKYYLTDMETGYKSECTKEQFEVSSKIWEAAKPKLTEKQYGSPIIFGTGGGSVDDFTESLEDFPFVPKQPIVWDSKGPECKFICGCDPYKEDAPIAITKKP